MSSGSSKHHEIEVGAPISDEEYARLKNEVLPELGFRWCRTLEIRDFLIPTVEDTTQRIRVERIIASADGTVGVQNLWGHKRHPLKGSDRRHVREEDEPPVSRKKAMGVILHAMELLQSLIPSYIKTRDELEGSFAGLSLTIALDHSNDLGKFSGRYMEIGHIMELDNPAYLDALAQDQTAGISSVKRRA